MSDTQMMTRGWRYFSLIASEFLGTFVAAHLFALTAFYNRGILTVFRGTGSTDYYSSSGSATLNPVLMHPWTQAFVVASALFFLYLIGSRFAERHLHLNPIISTVVVVSDSYRNYYTGAASPIWQLIILWLSQAAGSFAGAAVVWAFVTENISDAAIYVHDVPLGGALDGGLIIRACVSELVYGTVLLILLVFWMRPITYKKMGEKLNEKLAKCDYALWAMGLAGFYFFYLTLFWVYSKGSIDFIREGAYCTFAAIQSNNDGTSPQCSAGVYSNTAAGLYLFFLTVQGALVVVGLIAAAILAGYNSKKGYSRIGTKLR